MSKIIGNRTVKVDVEASPRHTQRFSDDELKRIQRKIDWRIMPWVCITYLFMRVDSTNISNAAIINQEQGHGIKQQLGLSAQQWVWIIACYSYPYAFLEPLSTLALKAFKPSWWMSRILLSWGIICMCIGASQSYGGVIATRTLLGAAEAGYYPGVIFFFSFWFRPSESIVRIAVFYAFGQLAGFISGFLSYAISFADSSHLSGWRLLFIIEGIPSVIFGLLTPWWLPDFPQTAKFLTEEEKTVVIDHIHRNAPSAKAKTWDFSQLVGLVKDPTFWVFSLLWATHGVGAFGISYVLPTVINDLGFTSTAMSNVLSMPPSLLAFIMGIVLSYVVYRGYTNAFTVAAGLELVAIACYIVMITVESPHGRYVALMISNATAGVVFPILWPKRVEAVRGTTAAGIAIGWTNACTIVGSGILAPQLFITTFGPYYHTPFKVCIGLLAVTITCIATAAWIMRRRPHLYSQEETTGSLTSERPPSLPESASKVSISGA